MAIRAVRPILAITVFALSGLGWATLASATGYWNMPGTFCQWCGCGFGGGYHAPLVLGPLTHECLSGPNEIRMPYPPNPYACAPYGNGGGCGCGGGEPQMMMAPQAQPMLRQEPVQQGLMQPEMVPEVSPRSPVFAPPVHR